MAQANKVCEICGELGHSKFYCKNKPYKPIKRTAIKKTIKPKSTKLNRSKIKKELDRLVKEFVKDRDDHICQYCGKTVTGVNCHASHILPVGAHPKMQFEPYNMKVLCYHHHINFWHKDPNAASEWFEVKFPGRYGELLAMESKAQKISTYDLQVLVNYYKKILGK